MKENITTKGRETISTSIMHGMIRDPLGNPFCSLWIERASKQDKQKTQKAEEKVGNVE